MTSLNELIAFNDEVASLSRAGVPIELGLEHLSRNPDIASNRINEALVERVHNGVSLSDILSEADPLLPSIYRSVVGIGMRCGHLPAGLEVLIQTTQSLLEVRRSLRSALVYPLVICGLAYLLFVGTCLFVPSQSYDDFSDLGSEVGTVSHVVKVLRESLPFWIAIPPALLIGLLLVGFKSSRRSHGQTRLLRWYPGVSRVIADQHCASFAELLALLVEHDVPMHEGLRLAARAAGDRGLKSAGLRMADVVEQGRPLFEDASTAKQVPPFLRWALTSPTEASGLARSLHRAAEVYRRRAERGSTRLRVVTPMLTCVFLAGSVTLLYCLSVFVPLSELINDLS